MGRYFVWIYIGLFSIPCFAELQGEVVEFGYYENPSSMNRERNLSTPTGYARTVDEVVLVKSTDKIPLQPGRLFGFKFKISGFPQDQVATDLRLVVTHPQITRPNGSIVSAYQYPVTLDVVGGVVENQSGYSLDQDFEQVEGDWRFQYWLKDKLLVEQHFQTVKPVPVPTEAAVQASENAQTGAQKNTTDKAPVTSHKTKKPLKQAKPGQPKQVQSKKALSKPAQAKPAADTEKPAAVKNAAPVIVAPDQDKAGKIPLKSEGLNAVKTTKPPTSEGDAAATETSTAVALPKP